MQLNPTGDGMDPPSLNAALEVILMDTSWHNPRHSRRQLQSGMEARSLMLAVVLPTAKHPNYFLSEGLTDRFPFTEWKLTIAFLELKGERDENRKTWLAVRGENNGKALKGPPSLFQATFSVLSQTLWRSVSFLLKKPVSTLVSPDNKYISLLVLSIPTFKKGLCLYLNTHKDNSNGNPNESLRTLITGMVSVLGSVPGLVNLSQLILWTSLSWGGLKNMSGP